jgi:hypothetical protein
MNFGSPKMSFEKQMQPQIREQMCLETHFQYEFSIRLGGRAAEEKKIQTAISMQLF